jgi:hypothetical protein
LAVLPFTIILFHFINSVDKKKSRLKKFKMRKTVLFLLALCMSIAGRTQMTQSDLVYYVGAGPDTAVVVVDFLDGTADSSYAWGYLFDASNNLTGGDALQEIAADESNLTLDIGGFLNDITFNAHTGIGGSPNYWGTWSRTSLTSWSSNSGIGEVLANGDWFGCSYTDFGPAIEPGDSYPAYASKWFAADDVDYWVGSGADTAIMVIDFVDDVYGEQVSYAWGYLFEGTTDGATMMADISANDANLAVLTGGGFLNDIFMNDLSGEAGSPYYWGTWSGTNLSDWTLNSGLSTAISNGDWFGASYADWEPRRPFTPSAAQDSAAFTFDDIPFSSFGTHYAGFGPDTAMVVIDFNQGAGTSYAFAYLFDAADNVTAEDALNDLQNASDVLAVSIGGGFLNDIVFVQSGIGGSPNYWSTWSAVNNGGWYLNTGISEVLANGDWFGCSYTDFSPATFPVTPTLQSLTSSLEENLITEIKAFPNPTTGQLTVFTEENVALQIFDLNGRLVYNETTISKQTLVDIAHLQAGIYTLISSSNGSQAQGKIVKQ